MPFGALFLLRSGIGRRCDDLLFRHSAAYRRYQSLKRLRTWSDREEQRVYQLKAR
jgi:hypothetical protein